MAKKLFCELTIEEATNLAKECKRNAKSEEEIRRRLTESGFSGEAAAITSISHGSMFMAMVMVWGPKNKIISV